MVAKYKVGFIGCGLMAMHHASAYHLNPQTEIVAAADTDTQNLALFCKRFSVSNSYLNYQDMLEDEDIDIIAPILPVNINAKAVIDSTKKQIVNYTVILIISSYFPFYSDKVGVIYLGLATILNFFLITSSIKLKNSIRIKS